VDSPAVESEARFCIKLSEASIIVDEALAAARARNLPPMTVTVLDIAGRLVAAKREDGSSLFRAEISSAKAWGALAMGMPTRLLAERAAAAPDFTQSLTVLTGGRFVPVPGGVLIRDGAGILLGAAGVSGAHPDLDEACATSGIAAAGLIADVEGAPR
jgi:uncharacterized protein GlcG (DUF336 family)